MNMSNAGGSLAEITALLHADLPLTKAMRVEVTRWDGRAVRLAAPLAPNVNHTATAFGGSISALSILTGYTLVYLLLRDRGIAAHLLIQKSTTDFLRPIDTDLISTATLPAESDVEEFLAALKHKRRGRLTIESSVFANETLAATHSGVFVAILC